MIQHGKRFVFILPLCCSDGLYFIFWRCWRKFSWAPLEPGPGLVPACVELTQTVHCAANPLLTVHLRCFFKLLSSLCAHLGCLTHHNIWNWALASSAQLGWHPHARKSCCLKTLSGAWLFATQNLMRDAQYERNLGKNTKHSKPCRNTLLFLPKDWQMLQYSGFAI